MHLILTGLEGLFLGSVWDAFGFDRAGGIGLRSNRDAFVFGRLGCGVAGADFRQGGWALLFDGAGMSPRKSLEIEGQNFSLLFNFLFCFYLFFK